MAKDKTEKKLPISLKENALTMDEDSYIRSDNGLEFVAKAVRKWIGAVAARTTYIEPGSHWENGYIESFKERTRDELLNGEIFYSLTEAVLVQPLRFNSRKTMNPKMMGNRDTFRIELSPICPPRRLFERHDFR